MTSLTNPIHEDEHDMPEPEEARDFSYALSPGVHVSLRRNGASLVVCFGSGETFEDVIDDLGWSVLQVETEDAAALGSEQVVGFFDAMVDGTLMDEFDGVLFVGVGAFAGAALGYSICAPLSRVVVFAPHGPLKDTDRYPPEAATIAAADKVQVIYDPMDRDSAETARAISARGADLLPMRFGDNTDVVTDLASMGVLETVLEDAMDRQLSDVSFFRALRARRRHNAYLRGVNARLIDADRKILQALVLRHIGVKLGRRRYMIQFEKLSAELAEIGVNVPDART